MTNNVPSPEEFFGFRIGEDRKLARWDKIVEYFRVVASCSERVKLLEMGPTSTGNPFIVLIVSSPENLVKLDFYRGISRKLAYPFDVSEEEAKRLATVGKAVVAVGAGIHATEVAGTQTMVELVYELAMRNDEFVSSILDRVVLVLIPCMNPDGQIMVVDWYEKCLGTESEGTPPPWLYHKYCGHDNNRDAFMLTQAESRYIAQLIYREYIPQVFIDHHQMGGTTARFFISPEMDPIYPDVDPLVWREIQFLGTYAAARLAQKGFKGVETYSPFTPDFVAGFQTLVIYMNIAGMLTESASVKLATPVYVHPHQLRGYNRGRRSDEPQMNYPDPWPGGWWKLRDIVEYQKESTYAILEVVAKLKEELLYNMYVKAKRSIERGSRNPPYAFIISTKQHDPLTAFKLVEVLQDLGIIVHVAEEPFEILGKVYPAGTFVVFSAQPRRALVKKLLEQFFYPDNEFTRDGTGKPIRPYDIATERLPDFMGVYVEAVDELFTGRFKSVSSRVRPKPVVKEECCGWLLDPRLNDTHRLVAKLLAAGCKVYRVSTPVSSGGVNVPQGAFYVPLSGEALSFLKFAAEEWGVEPIPLRETPSQIMETAFKRVGIYQRLYGGSMDEGWIRWLLDDYGIPYKVVNDDMVKNGKIKEELDILILPDDPLPVLKGENVEEELSKMWGRPVKLPPWPKEYQTGFGKEGVEKIKEFVESGGTLVCIGRSIDFLSKEMKLPLRNLSEELRDPTKFFCPGSTLRAVVDVDHPLAWGMPRETTILFVDGPVIEIVPSHYNEMYKEVVRFADRDLLSSGWLIGEEQLRRKPLLIEAVVGKGRALAYVFKPHFRGQTHATFKLLLNAVYSYK
ncbi:MAG: M14 family metallopeptidase [Thermofilaceae archaeon]|nr:M14 family metallopeptidase [Thermofilaceae archaeon]MCX8181268.1 M14 family metallopeptidase [Thermofilaceae archaeon]MDW8003513.1 M14 family metallopeptidase [Thermofilaceae archaeon]